MTDTTKVGIIELIANWVAEKSKEKNWRVSANLTIGQILMVGIRFDDADLNHVFTIHYDQADEELAANVSDVQYSGLGTIIGDDLWLLHLPEIHSSSFFTELEEMIDEYGKWASGRANYIDLHSNILDRWGVDFDLEGEE